MYKLVNGEYIEMSEAEFDEVAKQSKKTQQETYDARLLFLQTELQKLMGEAKMRKEG